MLSLQNTAKNKFITPKKLAAALSTAAVALGVAATPIFAAPPAEPGWYGTANPNAQCGSGAGSGAYADQYGNFSFLGAQHGANGYQTGINNSSVCGNRQSN